MGRDYRDWPPYVSSAERRRKAEREMAKLRKTGRPVAPVRIEGRAIATTFWGKAWCSNLESYRDYDNRLPRGRSYVRHGAVLDLQIAPREITALVSGTSIYTVVISIAALPKAGWRAICGDCTGSIDSLVELLQGRFPKAVMERLCRQASGLFPRPAEIRFACSCPDAASMCKHVAATLYGVGARLDSQPELLFRLRDVDETELVGNAGAAVPLSDTAPQADRVLAGDLAALFGLEMAEADGAPAATQKPTRDGTVDRNGEDERAPRPAPRQTAGKRKVAPRPKKPAIELTSDGYVKWWR
jgi:uncharacterized Zn finger protein